MKIKLRDFNPIKKYLRLYKKTIWIAVIFAIFENASWLIAPLFYGRVIDIVTKEKTFDQNIIILLFSWIAVVFIGDWFGRMKSSKAADIAYKSSQDIITKPIYHLLRLPLSFHKTKKIGEIIQRLTRAEGNMYQIIENGLFDVAPAILTSLAAFIIIAWIHWSLAIVYIIVIVIYFVLTIIKTDPIIQNQKKLNKVFEQGYGDIFDRTPNIIAIKSNTTEEIESARNEKNFDKGFDLYKQHMVMWLNLSVWQRFVFTLGFLALFTLGIYYIQQSLITIGQFVMLLAYVNILSASLSSLGGHYKRLQEGLVTIGRADKLFNEIIEDYDNPNAIVLEKVRGDVEFQNVKFSYEKELVLDNISFKAKAGKMVAIVGKSGEGKSTLVDLISRYNIPQKGKILLDGININKLKLKFLRDQIAIVSQEIDLFNDSIKNNIAYGKINATAKEIEEASKLAHCHEFISKFPKKYSQIVGEKGVKLSTGQKQRVAIARAILRDPKILILDEATSALDSESEKYVQEALQEVMKGRTTFIIAHRLSTIRKADLILVIEDGKIVESGDHKELLAHGGVYKKLSELQNISV